MKLTVSSIKSLALPEGVSEKTFFDDDLPGFRRFGVPAPRGFVVQYKIRRSKSPHRLGPWRLSTSAKPDGRPRHLGQGQIRPGPRRRTASRAAQGRRNVRSAVAAVPRAPGRPAEASQPCGDPPPPGGARQAAAWSRRREDRPPGGRDPHRQDRRAVLAPSPLIACGPPCRPISPGWRARDHRIDPTTFTNKAVESAPRSRVLSDAELAQIWRALDDGPYSAIVRLLMMTGARREEIGGLRWSEINFDEAVIVLPPARTKAARAPDSACPGRRRHPRGAAPAV